MGARQVVDRAPERQAIHVLMPGAMADRLRQLALRTRVTQADYIREAVGDLLRKHRGRKNPVVAPFGIERGELVSVVTRLDPAANSELGALSSRTRVRKSEYLREAFADLLAKHGARR